MITGMLLSWMRPDNVRRILASWEASPLITERMVWNNNPALSLRDFSSEAKIVDSNHNLTFYPRFVMPCLARNECVLIQDDDLMLSHKALSQLHECWRLDPSVIHGIFGRRPRPDGTYGASILGNREVTMVLTRALLVHRRYLVEFLGCIHDFDDVQRDSAPYGNGEDIILSYVVRRASGRRNRIHAISVHELAAPFAVSGCNEHYLHRTKLMHFCDQWLARKVQTTGAAPAAFPDA